MRKYVVALAATAAFAGYAYAGEAEGVVSSVDPDTRTITLESGQSYVAQEGVEIDTVTTGSTVRITYDDATMEATEVEAQ